MSWSKQLNVKKITISIDQTEVPPGKELLLKFINGLCKEGDTKQANQDG